MDHPRRRLFEAGNAAIRNEALDAGYADFAKEFNSVTAAAERHSARNQYTRRTERSLPPVKPVHAHTAEMVLSDFFHRLGGNIPVVWTVAHRGCSGNGRLDVWVFPDERTALRSAAELAMDCGLDQDAIAKEHFDKERYDKVIARYCETSPPSHVLAVQEAPLMQEPDTFFSEVGADLD